MTTLHLIRHGRASALEADYDQLHAMGETQARLLGEHLGRGGQAFDAVYVGPHRRQLETLRLMRAGAAPHDLRWPEHTLLPELAEGPFEVLFKVYLRPRIKEDAVLQARMEELTAAGDDTERAAVLESMFEHMVELWRSGEVRGDDLEPAPVFAARVAAAKDAILARQADSHRVAVVTSNGVIAELLTSVAGLTEAAPGRRRFHNSSVSIVALRPSVVLHCHDAIDHIADPALRTLL